MIPWEIVPWDKIDRVQDLLSIPIALYICVMIWRIRQSQKAANEKENILKNGG